MGFGEELDADDVGDDAVVAVDGGEFQVVDQGGAVLAEVEELPLKFSPFLEGAADFGDDHGVHQRVPPLCPRIAELQESTATTTTTTTAQKKRKLWFELAAN